MKFKVYGNHQTINLPLKKGWNLVGYSNHLRASMPLQDALSNTAGIRLVWRFFNNQWSGYSPTIDLQGYDKLTHMGSGGGYWVYVANDTNFAPPTLNHTFDGYEVWGGNFMTGTSGDIISNPAYYGYKRIGSFNPATTFVDNATFALNSRYIYAIIKHASLFGNPVKIDGLTGTSASPHQNTCLTNIRTFNVKNSWHLYSSGWYYHAMSSCVDNKTAQIRNNGGIAVDTLNTYVYPSHTRVIDNLTVISGR